MLISAASIGVRVWIEGGGVGNSFTQEYGPLGKKLPLANGWRVEKLGFLKKIFVMNEAAGLVKKNRGGKVRGKWVKTSRDLTSG